MRKTRAVIMLRELRARWRHRDDPLVCREVVELVTDYLEDAMSPADRSEFERHLRTCPDCVAYVEQTRRAAEIMGKVAPEPPTGATRAALLETFRSFHTPDQ